MDDLDEFMDMPAAGNVLSSSTAPAAKPGFFSQAGAADFSFLDEKPEPAVPTDAPAAEATPAVVVTAEGAPAAANQTPDPAGLGEALSELDEEETEEGGTTPGKKGGRPKLDRTALSDTLSKLVEKGTLFAFDDDKPLEDYTPADFMELIETNIAQREQDLQEQTPRAFFESLPAELQSAAAYVANGGKDLRALFAHLAQVQEVKNLDPAKEKDQSSIVRLYLERSQYGTPEEIADEIQSWQDTGQLAKKAAQFKPKLDKYEEDVTADKLAQQETFKQQQMAARDAYVQNIHKTLATGTLGDLKIDSKTQNLYYQELTQAKYKSLAGGQTNLLGALLEKYQYSEPRLDLIIKATMLLNDPEGFEKALIEKGQQTEKQNTVRGLKTEAGRAVNSGATPGAATQVPPAAGKTARTVARTQSPNFFKR